MRLLGVIAVVALIFTGIVWADEAGYGMGMRPGRGMMHRNFTDNDGDGMCDNYGAGMMRGRHSRGGCRFNRTNDCSTVRGKAVDKDDDGRCDFAPRHQNCPYIEAKGNNDTPRQRKFIDKDGDGMCDNFKSTPNTEKVEPKTE